MDSGSELLSKTRGTSELNVLPPYRLQVQAREQVMATETHQRQRCTDLLLLDSACSHGFFFFPVLSFQLRCVSLFCYREGSQKASFHTSKYIRNQNRSIDEKSNSLPQGWPVADK